MAAGLEVSGPSVNARAGNLVVALWNTLDDIHKFKLWLDDHNDTYLNSIGISGTATTAGSDVKVLRDSFADLGGASGLWAVSHGSFDAPGLTNYFFNAKNLTGTNWAG